MKVRREYEGGFKNATYGALNDITLGMQGRLALEHANNECEEGVRHDRCRSRGVRRRGRRPKEDVDLDREHDHAEHEESRPARWTQSKVEPHPAKQRRGLETQGERRQGPETESAL